MSLQVWLGLGYQISCLDGIDVSVWQGKIDWKKVKEEKAFSIIRSSVSISLL